MKEQEKTVQQMFEETGAWHRGHFVYRDKTKHGEDYLDGEALMRFPDKAFAVGDMLAVKFSGNSIDVVVGPETGGAQLAGWVAYRLQIRTGKQVIAIPAKKEIGQFIIRDGQHTQQIIRYLTGGLVFEEADKEFLLGGKRILLVDDIVHEGGTLWQTTLALFGIGVHYTQIAAYGTLWNRGGKDFITEKDIPLKALVNQKLVAWDITREECPKCRENIPIGIDVGHGKEFLAQNES